MRLRPLLSAAIVAAFAVTAGAALSATHQEWGQGPVQFLMTGDEAATWKTIGSDADASAFVDLFWARRDPTPATARNEFREQFDARVEYANQTFGAGQRLGGAMSDRGRALILFGVPRGMAKSGGNRSKFDDSLESDRGPSWIEWEYDSAKTNAVFDEPVVTLRFVDQSGAGDYRLDRTSAASVAAAQARAAARSVAQPQLTIASRQGAPSAAPQAAQQPATTPAAPAPAIVETTQQALDQAKSSAALATSFVSSGEFVTPAGQTFVAVSLYVPASARVDATRPLTFFGRVQDASGNTVASFDAPAKLVASKQDFFVDRSLEALPAGNYRGWFGLSENGRPVTLASADMRLGGGLDPAAQTVSPLLLSNNVYPLPAAQSPAEPFAFGGLKVVPKSDRIFRTSDDLWYFVELRNPGLAEPSADYVPIVGAAVASPRVQVRLEVEGTETGGKRRRMAAPLREIEAVALKGVPRHYAVGSSMPLASFKPGDYTFTLKLLDTVTKASYVLSEKFRIAE